MRRVTVGMAGALTLSASLGAYALGPMPDESGFSGFVGFGLGNTTLKSNIVAGTAMGDIGNDRIYDLGSAKSESKTSGFFNGEVQYTWADSKTQVFAGNSLENWLRYDFSSELGVRRQYDGIGEFSVSYLFSSVPTKVWKDPYKTDGKRKDTDRTSSGARVGWGNIMGSNFQVRLSTRKVEIDNEQSGEESSLSLTPAQQRMLSREGDIRSAEVLYRHSLGNGHFFIPSVQYTRYDLDGKAMAADEYIVQLSHAWGNKQWQTVTNLVYGQNKHDKANPIAEFGGKTQEDDIYGASFSVFYSEPFGWKNWRAMGSLAAFRASSNIDFYDTNITSVSAGLLYHF
ncbi:DUF2860 family protein [Kistimonas asteriae]|uniref:DUF2860 family protein n=1 Tax=Kistimonas asteriae TaxID=517724 RepID=UPI001BA8FA42|nr:DUF2860 family protein [Kistimonas asteriae]